MKANRIPMTKADGGREYWRVWRVPRAWNCGGNVRFISGWSYESADGVERFAEGNWSDLVIAFRLTAENYGVTTNIS